MVWGPRRPQELDELGPPGLGHRGPPVLLDRVVHVLVDVEAGVGFPLQGPDFPGRYGPREDVDLMRWTCARVLCQDEGATLADIREAVRMLDDIARTARRVFGGSHPVTAGIDVALRNARAVLRARETPPAGDTV